MVRLTRLCGFLASPTLALVLAVAMVALPVTVAVASSMEEFDGDGDETDTRETELTAPRSTTPSVPAPAAIGGVPTLRPKPGEVARQSGASSPARALNPAQSRLRC